MSISSAVLCEIHRILRQLSELRSRLVRGPRQAAAAEANVTGRQAEMALVKQTMIKSRMAVDERELQLKQREGRIEEVRRKLNASKSNREYQALLEQIAADEQANSVLTDEILELYDRITAEQEQVKQAETNLQAASAELDKVRKRVEGERDSLEADLARLTVELKNSEEQLPDDMRQDYQRAVKARADLALAPLEGGCCGGCFQQTTPQMFNELKLAKFVPCKSCGCILYLPEDTSVS